MTAIEPSTLVAAMAELDQELAVLNQRRQLLQQLLATWDDENGDTIDNTPTPAPVVASPAKAAAKPAAKKLRRWDYAEVADVINRGVDAGKTATAALVDHYGVDVGMAGYLMKRVRETSNDRRPEVTDLPKAKRPTGDFDPQRVAAALEGAA